MKTKENYFVTMYGVKISVSRNWVKISKNQIKNTLDGSIFIFVRMELNKKRKGQTYKDDLYKSIMKNGGFFISKESAKIENGKVVFKKYDNTMETLKEDVIKNIMNYTNKKGVEIIIPYETGSKKIKTILPSKTIYDYLKFNESLLEQISNPSVELTYELEHYKLRDVCNTCIRSVLIL